MMKARHRLSIKLVLVVLLGACASQKGEVLPPSTYGSETVSSNDYNSLIGPGDQLQVFVWRNPEISQAITVRPDGKISMPLVEDLRASGKTPTQLARELEKVLETYIIQPIITVIIVGGLGPYSEQIRVIGQVAQSQSGQLQSSQLDKPQAIVYKYRMTLLDVLIVVGGLNEFADGNKTQLLRVKDGHQKEYQVRVEDLLNGDMTANVDMLPGDILVIPESWF